MRRIVTFFAVAGLLVVGACTAAQVTSTQASVQTTGQLYCAKAAIGTPLVVGILTLAGAPALATNAAATTVDNVCSAWDSAAVPVSPPATAVPNVAVAAASALPVAAN